MKKISTNLAEQINDFYIESNSGIRQYALEKDVIVCDAIKTLTQLTPSENFRLIFCGGTCLSKAYGLLQRMSEDVDFKIVPTDKGSQLSRNALRTQLSAFGRTVVAHLELSGFGSDSITKKCLDEYKYTSLDVQFESVFEKPVSLRPNLLIELNFTQLSDVTAFKNIGSLFDSIAGLNTHTPFNVECVSLAEALTEKLVSFPRRLAMHIAKSKQAINLTDECGWDRALVRHLYDVCIIADKCPDVADDASRLSSLLKLVIEKDASEFSNQHPEFVKDPISELMSALTWARSSADLKSQYQEFISDMVYAPKEATPSFEKSINTFEKTLSSALSLIDQEFLSSLNTSNHSFRCKDCGVVPCICDQGGGHGETKDQPQKLSFRMR